MKANPFGTAAEFPNARCVGCVWHFVGGRGRAVDRCRRHANHRIRTDWPACPSYEPSLDCLSCGACCREAYDAVEVGRRDPFVRAHPERVVEVEGRLNVRRAGAICGCLEPDAGTWPCAVYGDRPKTCRDFAAGGANCVDARVRLGLTP
ncbi:MAG: YkgJ family cysteine cluster protein [Myxococcota bacterium]|nr:YkgJ family cysteine cluster protein [Myxococcota bacterium]MEC9388754.1 YkgJ family cysteine cluster protein [Myxococcota bacterium]